jgi:hypothetical protein
MKKWFTEFLNKFRINETSKIDHEKTLSETVNNIARDSKGRWVADDLGKPVLKTDDPARIAKFTKRQEDYYSWVAKETSCCGGGKPGCYCAPKLKPVLTKPTVNKKVEEVKAEAERQQEKYGTQKPVAKKKPTGGGTKKERPIE